MEKKDKLQSTVESGMLGIRKNVNLFFENISLNICMVTIMNM